MVLTAHTHQVRLLELFGFGRGLPCLGSRIAREAAVGWEIAALGCVAAHTALCCGRTIAFEMQEWNHTVVAVVGVAGRGAVVRVAWRLAPEGCTAAVAAAASACPSAQVFEVDWIWKRKYSGIRGFWARRRWPR